MNTKSRAHHWVSFASCLPVLHEPIASGWHRHVAPTWCHRSVRPPHDLLHAGNVLRRWALGIRRNAETRKVRAAPRNRATEFTQVFSWDLFFVSWCPKPINYKGKQRHCSDFQYFCTWWNYSWWRGIQTAGCKCCAHSASLKEKWYNV